MYERCLVIKEDFYKVCIQYTENVYGRPSVEVCIQMFWTAQAYFFILQFFFHSVDLKKELLLIIRCSGDVQLECRSHRFGFQSLDHRTLLSVSFYPVSRF